MEIWLPIEGFEDSYEISNTGKIRSLATKKGMWGKELKLLITNNGYYRVSLRKNNLPFFNLVHRLVAKHFIPNSENKLEVNHKNGIKIDNRAENLEWNTRQENRSHAINNKLIRFGENHGRTLLKEKDIHDIRFFCINRVPKLLISQKYKISIATVRDILYGDSWNYMNLSRLRPERPFQLYAKDIENIKELKGFSTRIIQEKLNYSRITIAKVLKGDYDNYYKILKTYFNEKQ